MADVREHWPSDEGETPLHALQSLTEALRTVHPMHPNMDFYHLRSVLSLVDLCVVYKSLRLAEQKVYRDLHNLCSGDRGSWHSAIKDPRGQYLDRSEVGEGFLRGCSDTLWLPGPDIVSGAILPSHR